MTTIVVFASSLFTASLLVTLKALEIRAQNKNFILRIISKIDHGCESLIEGIKFRTLQLIQSFRYIILVQVRDLSKNLFDKAHAKVIAEYKTHQETVMGKKNISSRGSVSFYLKKITEEKESLAKGKIEDTPIDLEVEE